MRRLAHLALGAALAVAGHAAAGTLFVANDGVDSPACGSPTTPCRSIGSGIAHASAGDVVEVGPGRYGDLDADGVLGSVPGEELVDATCACLIAIDEPITVRSRDGASATLIAPGDAFTGDAIVELNAEGAAFGERSRGFTVFGVASGVGDDGIVVSDFAAGAKVAGNLVLYAENGIEVDAPNVEITDNRAMQNENGIAISGEGCVAARNAAGRNAGTGFQVDGAGTVLDGNAAIGNDVGIAASGSDVTVRRSTIAGNRQAGARFVGSGHRVEQSSFYGNGDADAVNPNCGLTSDIVLSATGNYWGSALGPGHDPADLVCGEDVQFAPFATKDRALKLKPIR